MERFSKIVNHFNLSLQSICTKSSVLHVWQGSKYSFGKAPNQFISKTNFKFFQIKVLERVRSEKNLIKHEFIIIPVIFYEGVPCSLPESLPNDNI